MFFSHLSTSTIVSQSPDISLHHSTFFLDLAAGQNKGLAPWTALGAKLLEFVDQEYIPKAWRTVTSEGDNLYKFLDPSKFPMEMVSEALQFWYECQEKGKVRAVSKNHPTTQRAPMIQRGHG